MNNSKRTLLFLLLVSLFSGITITSAYCMQRKNTVKRKQEAQEKLFSLVPFAKEKDISEIEDLLNQGATLTEPDTYVQTCLYAAAKNKDLKLLNFYLKKAKATLCFDCYFRLATKRTTTPLKTQTTTLFLLAATNSIEILSYYIDEVCNHPEGSSKKMLQFFAPIVDKKTKGKILDCLIIDRDSGSGLEVKHGNTYEKSILLIIDKAFVHLNFKYFQQLLKIENIKNNSLLSLSLELDEKAIFEKAMHRFFEKIKSYAPQKKLNKIHRFIKIKQDKKDHTTVLTALIKEKNLKLFSDIFKQIAQTINNKELLCEFLQKNRTLIKAANQNLKPSEIIKLKEIIGSHLDTECLEHCFS